MLYTIARIVDESNEEIGFRLLDTTNETVTDMSYKDILEGTKNNELLIDNLEYVNDKLVINDESTVKYPVIDTQSNLINSDRYRLIILERTSLIEYRCAEYTGKIFSLTLADFDLEKYRLGISNGHIVDDKVVRTAGEFRFNIAEDNYEELNDLVNNYIAKCESMGKPSLYLNIAWEDIVLRSTFNEDTIGICDMPSIVTVIYEKAFKGKYNMSSIDIGEKVRFIGKEAFSDCTELESVNITGEDTIISSGAFEGCIGLNAIKLPSNLKVIYSNTFSGCESLKEIELSEGLEIIDKEAFANCKNLSNITIPESVKYIHEDAFKGLQDSIDIIIPIKLKGILDDNRYNLTIVHN